MRRLDEALKANPRKQVGPVGAGPGCPGGPVHLTPVACFLIAAVLLSCAAAHGETYGARAQRQLQEDACYAYSNAMCGRPNSLSGCSGTLTQEESQLRWGRVHQLCQRYKDRYGAWIAGCCDVAKAQDPQERNDRRSRWRRQFLGKICEMAQHKPPNRATMRDDCNEFNRQFHEWPDCCVSASIPRDSH